MAASKSKVTDPLPLPAEGGCYTVIRDTREKVGQGWLFPASKSCTGTQVRKLDTGDYTLLGYESTLCVERKGTVKEFASNLHQARFKAELERMKEYPIAVVILEFPFSHLATWPEYSGIPPRRLPPFMARRGSMLACFWRVQMQHPHVQFIFADKHGHQAASSLFKRVIEAHARSRSKNRA
jgi:hypothetical protein